MSSTYERPSAASPNGRHPAALTCEFTALVRPWRENAKGVKGHVGDYTRDELALRTGVPRAALGALPAQRRGEQYAAIDVVRLAVVDHLVRGGVPVACAAALVRAAESR